MNTNVKMAPPPRPEDLGVAAGQGPRERGKPDVQPDGVRPGRDGHERNGQRCRACGDLGRVRRAGHWANEMMGWEPCPECGDWEGR